MNRTLNRISVRLDVNLKNLTSKALAQIIVKVLYASECSLSKADIQKQLTVVNNGKSIADCEISEILNSLRTQGVSCRSGRYSLSTSFREKISNSIADSEKRIQMIIDKFFGRLNTERAVVEEWLTDVTIKFFESYSEEWISDLKSGTKKVLSNENSIRQLVSNRTAINKKIDAEDRKTLPKSFFDFICTSEPEVDAYLWEYGTSAFASQLVRTMYGVDEITIDTFRNSNCVLDTNILMFIALESKYKDGFVAIEKVFKELGVNVWILNITKKEYENTIWSQKNETLRNLEKLGYELTLLPNDDFTKLAKTRGCCTEDDFQRFFEFELKIPSHINEYVEINLLDNIKLADTIAAAEVDESKKARLNGYYKTFTNHDKSGSSLNHDIGLVEAVGMLRASEETASDKYFILSEEISVNQYSRNCGFRNGLPLSLRVNTLINLLAVNNGGDMFDAADYTPLFANIIRMGFSPHKDTFRQSELYSYYKMNSKISLLPKEKSAEIVTEVHKRMLDGRSEDELLRDLNEMITEGEIQTAKELEETKSDLYLTTKERDREKEKNRKLNELLWNQIKDEVTNEYDKETAKLRKKFKRDIPLLIILTCMLFCAAFYFTNDVVFWITIAFSVLASIIATIWCNWYAINKVIQERNSKRADAIRKLTDEKFEEKINQRLK